MKLLGFIGVVLCLLGALRASGAPIQPGKPIHISISGVPEEDRTRISRAYPVEESGLIQVPYVGRILAAGSEPAKLQERLQDLFKFRGYFTHAAVEVTGNWDLTGLSRETVAVTGFVKTPAILPFTKDLTLGDAIQSAGGHTEYGALHRVRITRDGMTRIFNATLPEIGRTRLHPGDLIEVPRKYFGG